MFTNIKNNKIRLTVVTIFTIVLILISFIAGFFARWVYQLYIHPWHEVISTSDRKPLSQETVDVVTKVLDDNNIGYIVYSRQAGSILISGYNFIKASELVKNLDLDNILQENEKYIDLSYLFGHSWYFTPLDGWFK